MILESRTSFIRCSVRQTGLEIGDESRADALHPRAGSRPAGSTRRFDAALEQVEATGYGIVMPTIDELSLERAGDRPAGRAVRRPAGSQRPLHPHDEGRPSTTEVSPIVGTEKQIGGSGPVAFCRSLRSDPSQDLGVQHLWQEPARAGQRRAAQQALARMPQEARIKLQETIGTDHQRGLHRPHLHLTLNKNSPRREFRRGLLSF